MSGEEENAETKNNDDLGKKFSPEEHYFWIDNKFLHLPDDSLSKKAILLYLLYARSCNPKQMQCSMIGFKAAKKCLGLSHIAVEKARAELIDKGYIKLRPDIKTGYFKTMAVEVLSFPSPDSEVVAQSSGPRSIAKSGGFIFIPSLLVDEGLLKELAVLELRVFLFLYSICRWEECLGIDFQFVHAWHSKVPKGASCIHNNFNSTCHPSIQGKLCFQVVPHKEWKVSEQVLENYGGNIYGCLNSLVDKGLLTYAPVVIWRDPEDSYIAEVRREVFPGTVKKENEIDEHKQKYRLAFMDNNDRVIWVLRPVYPAENSDYQSYQLERDVQLEEAGSLCEYHPCND